MRKIKVGLSALWYEVAMARYMWDALDRRDDVETYAVGPFFDDWIPWNNGMTLPKQYVKIPYMPLSRNVSQYHMPYEMVVDKMPSDLDLFLTIDAGWHFSTRPKAGVTVFIKTDPHAMLPQHYALPKTYSDITFCMQSNYSEPGDLYLPYAYDPMVHYPMDLPKQYDACLVGIQYQHRVSLIKALSKAGVSVYSNIGLIYDEYREVYNRSRIALNWSSLQDLPTRVFEYMGMNLPVVTNRVPDLANFFVEGEHYLGFDNVQEAVEQVRCLLASPEMANEIADNAYRKVQIHHTWDARMAQVLRVAKLIL